MTGPLFLSTDQVVAIHEAILDRHGGLDGVRDPGGLASAVATPRATFGGEFLYDGLASMAAAYAFHIAEAQAFLDGNKRTGVAAALVFLELNGVPLPAERAEPVLYRAMIDLAGRAITKEIFADLLRLLARPGSTTGV